MSEKSTPLNNEILARVATETEISRPQVEKTLQLLLDDCTIPFVARYRKEATGGLDEVQIRDIRDRFEYVSALEERKEAILKSIEEQGKLTEELKKTIQSTTVKTVLEDLYLPYKPKKRTRGQIAVERGLEPLALAIWEQSADFANLQSEADKYSDPLSEVPTPDVALKGANDYIAEKIAETPEIRGEIRQWLLENAFFKAEPRKEYVNKRTKYDNYYDHREPVKSIAPHRLMALRRGEKENILKVTLDFDEEIPRRLIANKTMRDTATFEIQEFLKETISDAFSRIISPSIETELRLESKSNAEEEASKVFAKNLRNLLLLPPIPSQVVLGIDPGIRTGSKVVVIDSTGKLLEYNTIYPDIKQDATSSKNENALEIVKELVKKHAVTYIAVGNGTGSREVAGLVEASLKLDEAFKSVKTAIVNEAGASVYSASDVAREEFPDLDLTIRGAVSIGRRLQDPLAELVKIDPKSIGVGQYQHDVNQTRLKKTLGEVVESCVNYVGVNLNTASSSLLGYVSGIGPSLAKNIVTYRDENGAFSSRSSLMDVSGFGPKAYQQSAGFLRVPTSENSLDNTGVHPEAYEVVQKMASDSNLSVQALIGNDTALDALDLSQYVTETAGLPTLEDIVKELKKPGRDPRAEGTTHVYDREVKNLNDLNEGQVVSGTVTNVTNFGAFVDIGVHQDGLVHISELSNQFVKDPSEVISVGDRIKVMIIELDKERKRISLSKKAAEEGASGAYGKARNESLSGASRGNPRQGGVRRNSPQGRERDNRRHAGGRRAQHSPHRNRPSQGEPKNATVEDLLAKFNKRR